MKTIEYLYAYENIYMKKIIYLKWIPKNKRLNLKIITKNIKPFLERKLEIIYIIN